MSQDSPANEEERLREIIMTVETNTSEPDREFLAHLKTSSTQRFVEAAAARGSTRRRTMAKIRRIAPRAMAASVLIAIGVGVVMLTTRAKNGELLGKARDLIESAKAMRMKVTGTVETPVKTTGHGHIVMAADGRVRQEMTVANQKMVTVFDLGKGTIVTLLPDQKIATVVHIKDFPKGVRDQMAKQGDHFTMIKKMVRHAENRLGEKTIGGIRAKGYRTANDSTAMEIWVDAETGMPVRIEMDMPGTMKVVMSEIEIVEKVDPDLFSVEVPKGYSVQKQPGISMKPAGVKELADLLKGWAEITDGRFPDTVDLGLLTTATRAHAKALSDPGLSAERKALMERGSQTVSACLVRAIMLKQSNQTFHYQGKGVKLGDSATPVLWYKPQGGDRYLVMYGDLHVERVTKENLPAKREPAAPKHEGPRRSKNVPSSSRSVRHALTSIRRTFTIVRRTFTVRRALKVSLHRRLRMQ